MYSFFQANDFGNLVNEPTSIVDDSKSCIDLMFTTNPFMFSNIQVLDKIANVCDHSPIFATLNYTYQLPKCYKRWVWNFEKANYERFNYMLVNAPWQSCYVNNDAHLSVKKWMALLLITAESCIPHYKATIRPADKQFINSEIRNLMRTTDRLKKAYSNTSDEAVGQEYRHCRNLILSECRKVDLDTQKKNSDEISQTDINSKKW